MVERRLRRLAVCNAVRRERVVRDEHRVDRRAAHAVDLGVSDIRRRPDADVAVAASAEPRARNLEDDRRDVLPQEGVPLGVGGGPAAADERAATEIEDVEEAAQVEEERVVAAASEELAAGRLVVDDLGLAEPVELPAKSSSSFPLASRTSTLMCCDPSAPGLLKRMRIVWPATASPFESTRKL